MTLKTRVLSSNTDCCTFDVTLVLSWWGYNWRITLKNISVLWSKGYCMVYHWAWDWGLMRFYFSRSKAKIFLRDFLHSSLTPKFIMRSFLCKRTTWEEFKSEFIFLSKYRNGMASPTAGLGASPVLTKPIKVTTTKSTGFKLSLWFWSKDKNSTKTEEIVKKVLPWTFQIFRQQNKTRLTNQYICFSPEVSEITHLFFFSDQCKCKTRNHAKMCCKRMPVNKRSWILTDLQNSPWH